MRDSESSKSAAEVDDRRDDAAMEGEKVRSVRLLVEEDPAMEPEDMRSSSA